MPTMIYNPSIKKENLKFKKINKIGRKKINLLNIARLTDQKNQIIILKALSELDKLNYNLMIIGNGSKKMN